MLTKLTIRGFKRFEDVEIELGQNVVFVGPNNSGKTTALQALALWKYGVEVMNDFVVQMTDYRLQNLAKPDSPNPLNRLSLTSIPTPSTRMLWRDIKTANGEPVFIEISVEGTSPDPQYPTWSHHLKFAFENEESIRVLKDETNDPLYEVSTRVTFLPSMSGIAAIEPRIDKGRIDVLIGEGRTAEVLRNLCYQLIDSIYWEHLKAHIKRQFGVELLAPEYVTARGEIRMAYKDERGTLLDISSAGRGMLQVLLLLAYLYNNPGAVILLDEPDAHLEILRQREIYQLLTRTARELNSQIIIATHSEIILDEAGDRDILIAFLGKPHRIDDRNKQYVARALKEIGFDQYYQAEQRGWVLYLEGSTDLAILRAFAEILNHPARAVLESPFVRYVANNIQEPRRHFHGLRAAKPDLVAFALFDHLETKIKDEKGLVERMWQRREIENYLFQPETLITFAEQDKTFGGDVETMRQIIQGRFAPVVLQDRNDRFWFTIKASDDVLNPLFEAYYRQRGLPNLMNKSDYHVLARYIPPELIDPEVTEKLDAILAVAQQAKPYTE